MMKNRILKNWMTTVLALVILAYCMVMMYKGSKSEEMIGFFGMAGLLLRSKDSLIGLPKEEDERG